MSLVLAFDDTETPMRDAEKWETGLVVRTEDGNVGLGFVLRDERGDPIAGALMNPNQAIQQGLWLLRYGARMLRYTNPSDLPGAALKLKVEMSLIAAETESASRPA